MNIIYISAGLIITSVNMINAGCCNKNEDKIGIRSFFENLEIYVNYITLSRINDSVKQNFNKDDVIKNMAGTYHFGLNDISINISIFKYISTKPDMLGGSDIVEKHINVVVGTKVLFGKQDPSKKSNMKPLCDTGLYITCIDLSNGNQLDPASFNVKAYNGKPGKFELTFVS